MELQYWDAPDPRQGPESPVSWRRGFRGPKTLISPRSGKGSFLSKDPLLSAREQDNVNSVQTRCIVKGEAQKSPLFWRFSGGF